MSRVTTPEERAAGEHRHTLHTDEIIAMRQGAGRVMATYPDVNDAPDHIRMGAVICAAAAALLEVHDDTGISLDDWTGPYELVVEALFLIGKDRTDFTPNGV